MKLLTLLIPLFLLLSCDTDQYTSCIDAPIKGRWYDQEDTDYMNWFTDRFEWIQGNIRENWEFNYLDDCTIAAYRVSQVSAGTWHYFDFPVEIFLNPQYSNGNQTLIFQISGEMGTFTKTLVK